MKEEYENEEGHKKEKELYIIPENFINEIERLNKNIEKLLEIVQTQSSEDPAIKVLEEYTKILIEKINELVNIYTGVLTTLKNIESKLDSLLTKEISEKSKDELSYTALRILEIVNEKGRVTDKDLRRKLKLKKDELESYLNELKEKNLVKIYEVKSFLSKKKIIEKI